MAAQEQIAAFERRIQLLERKNVQLERNIEEWKNILAKEIAENRQPVASGSGLPFTKQIAPSTSAAQSMRSPLIGEPQVDLSSFEGPEMESTLMS